MATATKKKKPKEVRSKIIEMERKEKLSKAKTSSSARAAASQQARKEKAAKRAEIYKKLGKKLPRNPTSLSVTREEIKAKRKKRKSK